MNHSIEKCDQYLMHLYNRHKITIKNGDGVYLYDTNQKKYLDFCSGIGVYAIGYHNSYFINKITEQISQITHTSNLFYHTQLADAAKNIDYATGLDKAFFTNSGAEAIEGALKLARKYAYKKHGTNKTKIIAMNHSFHGRTFGALSVTGNPDYRIPFTPLVDNVQFAEFNDLDSVRKLAGDDTCAIILEPIQGEGGIIPCTVDFINGIREICNQYDIVMICDEIQCGMGRSGSMFAYQQYHVLPDIVTCAKAIGGGIPVGAFAAKECIADAFEPGDHGTTYGCNPLACAAVNAVFHIYKNEDILNHVNQIAPYFEDKLNKLVDSYKYVTERRGVGLMQGLVFSADINVSNVVEQCLEKGLVTVAAHGNVIRFLPPLIIQQEHIDEMIRILSNVLNNL